MNLTNPPKKTDYPDNKSFNLSLSEREILDLLGCISIIQEGLEPKSKRSIRLINLYKKVIDKFLSNPK